MIQKNVLGPHIQLARVTLAEQLRFEAAFNRLKQPISDYTFANVYVWGSSLDLYWCEMHRHLCIFANGTGDLTMLLPPMPDVGTTAADTGACLDESFAIMDRYNRAAGRPEASRIEYVSDEMLERLRAAPTRLNLTATPMSGDFVYPSARMIDLAGGDLKSKRHGRSKFIREYPDHRTARLTDEHVGDCLVMLDDWQRYANESHDGQTTEDDTHTLTEILRKKESIACRTALLRRDSLKLTGMVVYVGDKLAGFTLGQAMSPAQASILFEKTSHEFQGCPQFIYSEFCRQYWSELPEINAGDDWGIPTLRFTKESYRPSRRLNKYVMTPSPMIAIPQTDTLDAQPTEADSQAEVEAAQPAYTPEAAQTLQRTVRAATTADMPQLLTIEHCAFSLDDAFSWSQIRRLVSNQRLVCRVVETPATDPAVERPRVVGWAVGLIRQHANHRSGRLYNVAIDPLEQGAGLGRLLTTTIVDELEAAGCRHVYLEVRAENQRAIALYRKLGFEIVRSLPDYYGEGSHGLSMRRAAGVAVSQATL